MKKEFASSAMIKSWKIIFIIAGIFYIIQPCLSDLKLSPNKVNEVKYENESYFVRCESDSTEYNNSQLYWTKGRQKKISDKGSVSANENSLYFQKISLKDSGEYICHAPDDEIKFKLSVTSPISFTDTPRIQTVQEHRPGFIKCKIKGNPKPKVIWKFQGRNIPEHKIKATEEGLKILNVTLEDRGNYTCKAFQVSEDVSMYEELNIQLNVQHKPLHKKPVHAKVNEAFGFIGGIVNLTCEAIAEPEANFTWYRQHKKTMPGRILNGKHSSILQLYINNGSMFGDYLCKASNSLGTLDQIITLQKGIRPPRPRVFALKSSGSDYLELTIIGPDTNLTKKELPISMQPTGFRIEYKIKENIKDLKIKGKENLVEKERKRIEGITEGWEDASVIEFMDGIDEDDQSLYFLNNLIHDTVYEVRVATKNIAGLSEFIGPHEYRTQRLQADSVTSGCTSNAIGTWTSVIFSSYLFGVNLLSSSIWKFV